MKKIHSTDSLLPLTFDLECINPLQEAEDTLVRCSRIHGLHLIAGNTDCDGLACAFANAGLPHMHRAWLRSFERVIQWSRVPVYLRAPADPLRSLHEKVLTLALYALRAGNQMGYMRALERIVPRTTAHRLRRDLQIVAEGMETLGERREYLGPLLSRHAEPLGPLLLH